jgi:ketosteroid isomerase-like protein
MELKFLAVVCCAVTLAAAPAVAGAGDESAIDVVKARFAAVARHDLEAVVALYAPDATETSPAFCADRRGPEGARKTYGDLFRSYPGIEDVVTAYVANGDHVAVQFIARIRNPDGTTAFAAALANFLIVEHGHITRDDTYFDAKGRPCA